MDQPQIQQSILALSLALRRLVPALGMASFAAILFGIKLLVIGLYGNATPYWDQWGGEAKTYLLFLNGQLEWEHLLAAHCEHRILIPRLLALGLLSVNGVWNPLLQMVVNAGLHVGFVCLLINRLTLVLGDRFLPIFLFFGIPLFGWPYGWENTLAGFQSCFYLLLIFSIGAIWVIINAAPFSARWWGGTFLAICGFLSLASGVFSLAAVAAVGVIQYLLGIRTSRLHLASAMTLCGLLALGVAITPSITEHASLKASTFPQLLYSWDRVLGWPIQISILGSIIRNAPAFIFALLMLLGRPSAYDRRWFLFALVLWMFGQSAAIAYGRSIGFIAPRYMDLFAIDVLTNFACLFLLVKDAAGFRVWTAPAAAAWTAVVLGCLGVSVHKHCGDDLQQRLEITQIQEGNTRNYVLTGDTQHVKDKPFMHVPYPDLDQLTAVLDNPSMRAILPRNIGAPLKGSLIESGPATAERLGGCGPKTPSPMTPAWGTYGPAGVANIGKLTVTFPSVHRGHKVEIPVAGMSSSDGITLEIEQDADRWPLRAVGESDEAWGLATATVRGRPFTLHITDNSSSAWIAVGSPIAAGALDGPVDRLLKRWDVPVIIGSVMAVALLTFSSLASKELVL